MSRFVPSDQINVKSTLNSKELFSELRIIYVEVNLCLKKTNRSKILKGAVYEVVGGKSHLDVLSDCTVEHLMVMQRWCKTVVVHMSIMRSKLMKLHRTLPDYHTFKSK